MGVANVPQNVRVQGVTTLAALAEVAHTWRSHFTSLSRTFSTSISTATIETFKHVTAAMHDKHVIISEVWEMMFSRGIS
jgi:hypothetical protein